MRRCFPFTDRSVRWPLLGIFIVVTFFVTSSAFAQRQVSLESLPLKTPIGDVNKIELRGDLAAGGEIVLDGNAHGAPDRFGDYQTSTTAYFPPIAITFREVPIPDPLGKRRKLYEIVGDLRPPKTRYYLVSPSRQTGNYRLVVDQVGQDRRVISLERLPPLPAKSERVAKILKVDYAILTSQPPQLVVEAEGEVNSSGWSDVKLLRRVYVTPPADGIWEYDLFATPPEGTHLPVISKVKASNRWPDYDTARVKGVRVYGEGGGVKEILFKKP